MIQSFSISQRELLIKKNSFLAAGTFSNNSNKNNTVRLQQIGYFYSAEIANNINDNIINSQWRKSEAGIALSYTVFSNGKHLFIYMFNCICFVYTTAETAIYDKPIPDY